MSESSASALLFLLGHHSPQTFRADARSFLCLPASFFVLYCFINGVWCLVFGVLEF
jgi:hypothetical protein